MSSRTPEECVELALDDSATDEEREDAIDALERANECDELAAIVRREAIGDGLRRHALGALATPQCEPTLEELADDERLDRSLRAQAESSYRDLEDG